MNRVFNYIYAVLFTFLAIGLNSCTDDYEYEPASATNLGGNAYLASAGSTSKAYLPTEEQSFTFYVSRIDSTQAGDVTLASSNSKFTVPATVSFAAGQKTAEVTVNFNIATGSSETTRISIADADKFYYGATVLDYTITRYQEYHGVYVSYGLGFEIETPCYQMGAGQYMIPANAEEAYEYNLTFSIDADNNVIVKPQPAWNHANYGAVYVMGNLDGDAAANGSGSGLAGSFDPKTGIVKMMLYHYVPGVGSFGTFEDNFVFDENPE